MPDHALRLGRDQLTAHLVKDGADARVLVAIATLAQGEVRRDQEAVVAAYAKADDDAGAVAFQTALESLLQRANFTRVSDAEFADALAQESVFQVRLHTDPKAYADLRIWRRGSTVRRETVRRFKILKREVEFAVWDRVCLFSRLKPGKGPATLRGAQLKLFADIPDRDLEMVLPDTEVRMRNMDKLVLVVPALFGIGAVLTQLTAALGFLVFLILGYIGLSDQRPDINPAQLAAFGAALFFIAMFVNKQISRYRLRRLTFLRTLGETLYGRTLDSGTGVIHHLAELAADQDAGEAMLAWVILGHGPADLASMDAAVERWLAEHDCAVDFEADDALARCQRWGLAEERDGQWHALPAGTALESLRRHWSGLMG